MGPTASGKTDLAIELAQQLPIDLVSVDSTQVYRQMNIGSGKPDADTLARFPHRLIDINDPSEPYSAADFRSDAFSHIEDIVQRQRIPLLVGGTMLYFKVLRDGLARLPGASQAIRAEIENRAAVEGWQSIHNELARVDPPAAKRIHPNDPQRLQRALEVYLLTGKPLTELHQNRYDQANLPFRLVFLALMPEDRSQLHQRIEHRFRHMLKSGLVEEVRLLRDREDLHPGLPSIKSVGYRQVWQYLEGELNYDAMLERGIIATRQLAKRQHTWLRSWPELTILGSHSGNSLPAALNILESAQI